MTTSWRIVLPASLGGTLEARTLNLTLLLTLAGLVSALTKPRKVFRRAIPWAGAGLGPGNTCFLVRSRRSKEIFDFGRKCQVNRWGSWDHALIPAPFVRGIERT
jgi:hypothetical protein